MEASVSILPNARLSGISVFLLWFRFIIAQFIPAAAEVVSVCHGGLLFIPQSEFDTAQAEIIYRAETMIFIPHALWEQEESCLPLGSGSSCFFFYYGNYW